MNRQITWKEAKCKILGSSSWSVRLDENDLKPVCCCNVIAWRMFGYLILSTFLLYKAYRRHLKRYLEIIRTEHDYQQCHNLTLNADL